MEAMSAGLLCVHPNLGALYETAAGFTQMYQWSADKSVHADVFARALDQAIDLMKSDPERARRLTAAQSARAGIAYNWDHRAVEWETFLRSLIGAQWSEHGG
jgi:hypothetical protein